MQNQKEITRINSFLTLVLPAVVDVTKRILQSLDFQVIEKGQGLDKVFSIKAAEKEAEFHLHNLFLEIATVDRDEEPLRFDEKLQDFDYFMNKMIRNVESKLRILFHLFGEEDVEKAIENITKDAKLYDRIRILRIDLVGGMKSCRYRWGAKREVRLGRRSDGDRLPVILILRIALVLLFLLSLQASGTLVGKISGSAVLDMGIGFSFPLPDVTVTLTHTGHNHRKMSIVLAVANREPSCEA